MFYVLLCFFMCFIIFDMKINFFLFNWLFFCKLLERIYNVVLSFNCLCIKDNKEVVIFVILI